MTDKHTCNVCGEPMPEGEEMFKFHGMSCDCPKPPLARTKVMIEYVHRDTRDGEFWIDVTVEGLPHQQIGPFATTTQRQRAYDDLLTMLRSLRN